MIAFWTARSKRKGNKSPRGGGEVGKMWKTIREIIKEERGSIIAAMVTTILVRLAMHWLGW